VTLTSRICTSAAVLALAFTAASAVAESTVVYSTPTDIVVKRADGQLVNNTISASTMVSVAGKKVPATTVKPGTKLSEDLPDGKIVTGISSAKGKVYLVSPPDKVTLSLAEGIKELTVPAGTSFTVAGKKMTIADLKKDMPLEATVIATTSGTDAGDNKPVTSTPAINGPILLAVAEDGDLPAAGTNLPLYGILGCIALFSGLALRSNRFARIKS
jgi:hypothetical protein